MSGRPRLACYVLVCLAARCAPAAGQDGPSARDRPRIDRYGHPLPEGAVARLGTARFRHGSHVEGLAFTRDGKLLLSAGGDGLVRVQDAATGRELRRIKAGHWLNALALSPDGRTVACGGDTQAVSLLDLATGKEVRQLTGHSHIIRALAFAPDGKTLASASWDRTLRLWDVRTGRQLQAFAGYQKEAACVAFGGDGKLLASGDQDGIVRLHDPVTLRELRRLKGHEGGVTCVGFAPDGRTLAAGGTDRMIHFHDVRTGKLVRRFEAGDRIRCLALSADGKRLAAAGEHPERLRGRGSTVYLWDAAGGRPLHRLRGHSGHINAVAFAPDGRTLAAAGQDHVILFWDTASGRPLHAGEGHGGGIAALAFSADGRTLAAAGWSPPIRLWDVSTGKPLRRLAGHRGRFQDTVGSVAFSRDGGRLASVGDDNLVRLWDAAAGTEVRRLQASKGAASCAALSPDGRLLAAGYGDEGCVRLWDMATGKELRRLAAGVDEDVRQVSFTGDAKAVVAIGSDGRNALLRSWDAATGKELRHASASGVHAVALSADGRLVVMARPRVVRLLDSSGGIELQELAAPAEHTQRLALSADGRLLAGGDRQGQVRLWEVVTGRRFRQWRGHNGEVGALAFAPDGRLVASGGEDTTVLLWDVVGPVGPGPLSHDRQEALWRDLADPDPGRGQGAVWALAAAPAQAVPLLKDRLMPLQAVAAQVARLIGALDDPRIAVRDKATRELTRLGKAAVPMLKRALAADPSPEVRRRVGQLLARLPHDSTPAEQWRTVRAVQTLEHAGGPEARRLLQALAAGSPADLVTREARISLGRLTSRRPSTP
jgi:WD40 repeat protein